MKCGIADVGSNTIRLSIYRWEGTQFKLLLNKKVMASVRQATRMPLSESAPSLI